jgi:hypothetical protein
MKLGAFTLFWLVLLGWQFGVYTYSNVGYFGPLFAGTHDAVNDFGDIAHQINLDTATFPNSVFGAATLSGRAYCLYTLGPYAAALIGVGIFYAIFFAGKRMGTTAEYAEEGPRYKYMQQETVYAAVPSSPSSTLGIGSSVGLRSPLDPKGSAQ